MKYYVIDAFTSELFGGNPAGVCVLDKKISDALMLKIAAENNLSETAFLLKEENRYLLRWFTPELEFDLCGHATLGTSYVVFNELEPSLKEVEFDSKSGILKVSKVGDQYILDFPSRPPTPIPLTPEMEAAFDKKIIGAYQSRDLFLEFDSEEDIATLTPDFKTLGLINANPEFGVIVTAQGSSCDFVSRYFSPNSVIGEDPVTGSAHCSLIPFWSQRLNKTQLTARQLSRRGGLLNCQDLGARVKIGGGAVCYLKGEIEL